MSRWIEVFEGENNRLSMLRLTVFLSFWPASAVLLCIRNTESLAVYFSAYVGGIISGKGIDVLGRKKADVLKFPAKKPKS